MATNNQAIDGTALSVACPKCGTLALTTVGDPRQSIQCPACGGEIDMTTDEVKHARQAAAAKASIETHQDKA